LSENILVKVEKNLSLNKFADEALLVEKLLKEADFLNNPDIGANAEKNSYCLQISKILPD